MDKICKGLFIGDSNTASDVSSLQNADISLVVNCAEDSEIVYPEGVQFEILSLSGEMKDEISKPFAKVYPVMDYQITKEMNVLIHCRSGKSRSGALATYYMMRRYGLSYENAYYHCKSMRKKINVDDGFARQLQGNLYIDV